MDTMFAEYFLEREGKKTLTDDKGFIVYKIEPPYCLIDMAFVRPEHRKSGVFSSLAKQVEVIAKNSGCACLLASVSAKANGRTEAMKVALSYGFEFFRTNGELVVFKKGIK